MDKNDRTTNALGASVLIATAGGLAYRVHRAAEQYDQLLPSVEDMETMRISAELSGQPSSWETVYQQARNRTQGKFVLENAVLLIGAAACLYGAYRCISRIFR